MSAEKVKQHFKPTKIVELCERAICAQISHKALIPFHLGLKILINVNQYLDGNYYGHLSWTMQFYKKYPEEKEKNKMLELVDMEKATPFDRLLLVLVGREKTGKSRLAATGRKGVLLLDWDGRREAVAGMKGVRAVTLRDPGNVVKQPTAFSDGLTILSKLEASRTFSELGFKDVPPEQDHIKTVVVDSMYSMARAARNYALFGAADLRRVLSVGPLVVFLPNGWDAWNAEINSVEGYIMRLLAISDIDIILIFHEDDEEAPGSSAEKRIYTGRFETYPARYGNILKYFNETWRLTRTASGPPQIQVQPNYTFQAATNLGIQNTNNADISKLIEDYLKGNPQLPNSVAGVQIVPSLEVKPPTIKGVV